MVRGFLSLCGSGPPAWLRHSAPVSVVSPAREQHAESVGLGGVDHGELVAVSSRIPTASRSHRHEVPITSRHPGPARRAREMGVDRVRRIWGYVIAGHGVTPFLDAAQAAGCKTANGDRMVEAAQDLMVDFMLQTADASSLRLKDGPTPTTCASITTRTYEPAAG